MEWDGEGTTTSTTTTTANLKRWLTEHQQQQAAVGMGQSIALNVVTLAAGLVIFKLMRMCKRRKSESWKTERLLSEKSIPESRSALESGPGYHTTALNYLMFLRLSAELCTMLTLVSMLVVVPHWGVQPFLLGGFGGHISLAEDIDATGICLLGLQAFLSGVVVLVFAQRMKRHTRVRSGMIPRYSNYLDKSLWLTHLPVGDNLTRERFTLGEEEFRRVEETLAKAIEDHVKKRRKNPPSKIIVRLHVPFVVDDYYLKDAKHQELKARLELWMLTLEKQQSKKISWWNRYQHHLCVEWSTFWVRYLQAQVKREEQLLEQMRTADKHMSGSAFVTFQDKESKNILLEDVPSCWKYQSYTYFKFGVAPFQSVTLRCQQAPHPNDILWENLHVTFRWRYARFTVASSLLLVFMLVLVTPVSLSTQLNSIITELRKGSHEIRHKVEETVGVQLPEKDEVFQWMSVQLPTMVILLINSLVLPYFIGEICHFQRSHTLSKVELNQMHMNYVFMVLNQLMIPLLGLTGMPALLEFLEVRLNDQKEDISILQLLDGSLLRSPGLFYVRYLLNCACLTNTNSLLNLPQLCMRWLTSTTEPWNFAWGYWYAATLGCLTTAVCLGVLVPSLPPVAALFFTIKYCVDSHILKHRAYLCGPESQGQFLPRVLFMMRMIVVGTWLAMGSSLQLTAKTYFGHRWDSRVPLRLLEACCLVLVISGSLLGLCSWWAKNADVHNAKFQTPRYSPKKEHEWNIVDPCLDAIFGKLKKAIDSATVRKRYMQVSEESCISTSLNFSRRDSAEMEEHPSDDADFMLIWDCRRWLSIWKDYAAEHQLPQDVVSMSDF